MFRVYMFDDAVVDDVVVAIFDTEAEAEAYVAECNADDIAEFGEIMDDLWIEEA